MLLPRDRIWYVCDSPVLKYVLLSHSDEKLYNRAGQTCFERMFLHLRFEGNWAVFPN